MNDIVTFPQCFEVMSASPRVSRRAAERYALQEQEDDTVCSFGPDFFFGARFGAAVGGLFSSCLCVHTYKSLQADQRLVDFEAGLKRGQQNPHQSAWVVLRGLRTQPMMTLGCLALATTSLFKVTKFALAHTRCREFQMDDVEFDMLRQWSAEDPRRAEELHRREAEARGETRTAGKPSSHTGLRSVDDLLRAAEMAKYTARRPPTYYDGMAVGLMGSIMDCYLPQKPLPGYYNMHLGWL